jgi:hypothetical protein
VPIVSKKSASMSVKTSSSASDADLREAAEQQKSPSSDSPALDDLVGSFGTLSCQPRVGPCRRMKAGRSTASTTMRETVVVRRCR